MDIYKKAASKKLRFGTSFGNLSVEQLFTLSIDQLDNLAVHFNEINETSNTKTFLTAKSETNVADKLRFEIVLDILNSKVANQEKAAKSEETKKNNSRILEILKDKQDQSLKDLSVEELTAKLQ